MLDDRETVLTANKRRYGTVGTRDRSGRFVEGNPGGPGRPKRESEVAYVRVLAEECPLDVWRQVVRRAVISAKKGDPRAREWLGRYLVGTPETRSVPLSEMDRTEQFQDLVNRVSSF